MIHIEAYLGSPLGILRGVENAGVNVVYIVVSCLVELDLCHVVALPVGGSSIGNVKCLVNFVYSINTVLVAAEEAGSTAATEGESGV